MPGQTPPSAAPSATHTGHDYARRHVLRGCLGCPTGKTSQKRLSGAFASSTSIAVEKRAQLTTIRLSYLPKQMQPGSEYSAFLESRPFAVIAMTTNPNGLGPP
jgi:hypothetical protein